MIIVLFLVLDNTKNIRVPLTVLVKYVDTLFFSETIWRHSQIIMLTHLPACLKFWNQFTLIKILSHPFIKLRNIYGLSNELVMVETCCANCLHTILHCFPMWLIQTRAELSKVHLLNIFKNFEVKICLDHILPKS